MRQKELVSASRVAILEQLSASIGEINQPICALVLNAEAALQLLRAQPTNTGAVRRLLACIVKDGLRTGDIVRRTRALIEKAQPVSETQCPVNVDSGRSVSKIFYAETFAMTRRAISGLSLQMPSERMTKSAGSKT
jgi:hypothetical protein